MNRLDDYIASLTRALRGVPSERVTQEIGEVREHVEQLAEHNRNLGLSDDDATAEAIQQFGSAKSVGQKLKASWLRANPLARGHFLVGFAFCMVLEIVWWIGSAYVSFSLNLNHRSSLWLITYIMVLRLAKIFGCFGMGWIAAWASPKRATIAVAATFVPEILITLYSMSNIRLGNRPLNLPLELAEIALHVCLAVFGVRVAQKWLVRRARRLAS